MNKEPLTRRENEHCRNEYCRRTIQDLKNKLRLKEGIIKKLQCAIKMGGKSPEAEILLEYEELLAFKQDAEEHSLKLLHENQVLGQVIEKLKERQVGDDQKKENEELKKGILDITDEFNKYRASHSTSNEKLAEYISTIKKYENKIQLLNNSLYDSQSKLEELEGKYSTDMDSLLENNKKLNEAYEELNARYEFYKEKYIEEVKEGNKLQERQKTLLSEIQVHIQYISILEQQVHDLESKVTNTNDSLKESTSSLRSNKTEELLGKIKLLSEAKERVETNLSICRHNLYQHSIQLQENQSKLLGLEKMRLSDLLQISRLENLLTVNKIKY